MRRVGEHNLLLEACARVTVARLYTSQAVPVLTCAVHLVLEESVQPADARVRAPKVYRKLVSRYLNVEVDELVAVRGPVAGVHLDQKQPREASVATRTGERPRLVVQVQHRSQVGTVLRPQVDLLGVPYKDNPARLGALSA